MENQPFPKQVYLWGSILEKIDWTRCWARWAWLGPAGRAGLGWDGVLAPLAGLVGRGVGRGVWPCWARWLGWAWCWACWARWLGWAWCWAWGLAVWARWLGWAWCWAWGLAALGALAGLVGRGVGRAGRAGWVGVVLGVGLAVLGALAGLVGCGVGRGVWPCWARWLGWAWCWACWARWLGWAWCWAWGLAGRWLGRAWCWAWGLAVLGVLAGLGVVWACWARWLIKKKKAWGLAVLGDWVCWTRCAGLGVGLGFCGHCI